MTQPPEERDPQADKAPEQPPPEDQPTVAWTPASHRANRRRASRRRPSRPSPGEPPPASPIISASPAATPAEPAAWPPPPEPAGPLVAWETPGAAAAAPGQEGFVISGMGARSWRTSWTA